MADYDGNDYVRELRAEVERLQRCLKVDQERIRVALVACELAESRLAATIAQNERLRSDLPERASLGALHDAQSSLASATELLRRWEANCARFDETVLPDTRDFLATQPAAQDIKTESYCGFEYPSVELSHAQPAAPARTETVTLADGTYKVAELRGIIGFTEQARTEAEQAVLDAMRRAPEETIRTWATNQTLVASWVGELGRAELARRGLKP